MMMLNIARFSAILLCASAVIAQTSRLPSAPRVSLLDSSQPMMTAAVSQRNQETGGAIRLTRQQAEQIAVKNNPRVSVAQLLALAQHQVVRETRSAMLPNTSGNITAVEANEASRISSGALTASRLLEHAGMGVQLEQLITDFGRTNNLISSSKLMEKSQKANAEATREQIILATDFAFYNALEAQATLNVARQTVNTRQALTDQVSQLTKSKLKSDLDLSFAQVNLSQAKLLQLEAQNNYETAIASLTAVLGSDAHQQYELMDDTTQLSQPPPDENSLEISAMQQRPDLQALDFKHQANQKFARAQWQQLLPSISALGVVGKTPVGSSQYFNSDWYGAIGGNLNIPIFNGFRYSAEAHEAELRARASAEQTRDLRDQIARDVRAAWLRANTAYQKVVVGQELLREANMGLDLAQTRYQLGLSSIVELSQAQLQQTEAAIDDANARYQYQFALATLNYQIGTRP
jgi:outer membrane protein